MNELYEQIFWDESLKLSDRKFPTGFSFIAGKEEYNEEVTAKDFIIQKIHFAQNEISNLRGYGKETLKEMYQLQYLIEEHYPLYFAGEQIRFGNEYESVKFIMDDLEKRLSNVDTNIKVSDIKKVCENAIKKIISDDYKFQRETIKKEILRLQKEKNDENKRLINIDIDKLGLMKKMGC